MLLLLLLDDIDDDDDDDDEEEEEDDVSPTFISFAVLRLKAEVIASSLTVDDFRFIIDD